jgi:hypothetical protein
VALASPATCGARLNHRSAAVSASTAASGGSGVAYGKSLASEHQARVADAMAAEVTSGGPAGPALLLAKIRPSSADPYQRLSRVSQTPSIDRWSPEPCAQTYDKDVVRAGEGEAAAPGGRQCPTPELIIVGEKGDQWVQPQFFHAPLLALDDNDGMATIWIDALDRTRQAAGGLELIVTFRRADREAAVGDQSELYRCEIVTDHSPETLAVGKARQRADGGIDIRLYHHTTREALALIHQSGHVRGSAWNFQGTRKLANVAYAYFTSMRHITKEADLRSMAMASSGRIPLRLDTNAGDTPDLVLDVYRASTLDRRSTLQLWVPAEAISTPHVWRHTNHSVYYEITHPWIYRVGLEPGRQLDFAGGAATPATDALRRFDYAVLGDCSTVAGLEAPYDEENTAQTFLVQPLDETNLFNVWAENANIPMHAPPRDRQTFLR